MISIIVFNILLDLFPDLLFEEKSSDAHGDTPHQTGPVGNLQVPAVASKDDVKDVLLGSNRVGDEPDTSDDPGLKRRLVLITYLNFL